MNNEEKILNILERMDVDISGIKGDISGIKGELSGIKGDISGIKGELSDLKTRVTNIELTQENVILPQLVLLAEGQQTILETLAPKNRVEALEDEMTFMKSVVRSLSQRLDELQQAQ